VKRPCGIDVIPREANTCGNWVTKGTCTVDFIMSKLIQQKRLDGLYSYCLSKIDLSIFTIAGY
jgi:hypothetical protein